jgi:hypothetical protein
MLWAELIADCWNHDKSARPSFAQIVSRLKKLAKTPEFSIKYVVSATFASNCFADQSIFSERELATPLSLAGDEADPVEWTGYQDIS